MVISISIDNELLEHINNLKKLKRTNNVSFIFREAFLFFIEQNYSYIIKNKQSNPLAEELSQQAADLPGMTAEVIQSHLVRFPKVTPDAYKGIIEELRARQNSEEGLKNPEAAAYGLCKRIQNGQARRQEPSATQEPGQPQPTADIPDPFAVY